MRVGSADEQLAGQGRGSAADVAQTHQERL